MATANATGAKPSRICDSPASARASCAALPMRFAARACAKRWCCCKFAGVFAAEPIEKLVRSAVANAGNNHDMNTDDLYITRITVDGGPGGRFTKRLDPRAQGRARTSSASACRTLPSWSARTPPAKQRKKRAGASRSSRAAARVAHLQHRRPQADLEKAHQESGKRTARAAE